MRIHSRVQPPRIIGVNRNAHPPFRARLNRRIGRKPVQLPQFWREKQPVGDDLPVPVALIGTLQRQGIALLALTQRQFARFDTTKLIDESDDTEAAEQHDPKGANANTQCLLPP